MEKARPPSASREDDLAEVRGDAERRHLLGLHAVRAVGDQAELGLAGEAGERPAGVVEQGQLRLVVAVGLEQAGKVLGLVVGQLLGQRHVEQLAQMPVVEEARHVGGQAFDAELGRRPAPRRLEARERELPLGIERVVEIEDQDQPAHGAARGSACRTPCRCHTAMPENGGRARLVRKAQRQRHLREQGPDAEQPPGPARRRRARRPSV